MIWVEILSRERTVLARHRCAGPEIRIGRSYGSDVVLDDPFVAPQHLRIAAGPDGKLVAEDLGSANGLFAARGGERQARIVLDGDRPIRIGRTLLRIRDDAHPVAAERVIDGGRWSWAVLLGLAAAIIGIEAMALWLNETGEPKLSRYLIPLVLPPLVACGWSGVWAVLSRIFAGEARFARNLLIALGGILVYSLSDEIVKLLTFGLTWPALASWWPHAIWLLLGVVCFLHLRAIDRSRLFVKGGLVAALVAVALGSQLLSASESRAELGQRSYVRRLLPPALRLAPLESEDAFFADAARLKAKLDQDRKRTPSGSWIATIAGGDDGDD